MNRDGSGKSDSPPHPRAPAILEELLDRTRQPTLSELKDNWRCHVCHDPWMTGETPELPIKLACGHIVGAGCMMRWLNPLTVQGNNSCSICRAPILRSWNKNGFRAATAHPVPIPRAAVPSNNDLTVTVEALRRAFQSAMGDFVHLNRTNAHEQLHTVVSRAAQIPAANITQNMIQRPTAVIEESYTGAAGMFETAEAENAERERLIRERIQAEARRHLWLQFCEGVVSEVEAASDERFGALARVAREIVNLRDIETFLEVRRFDGEPARRILRTFPSLHTKLVLRLGSLEPIPGINIQSYLRLEHNLGPAIDFNNLHAACWCIRLCERVEGDVGDEVIDPITGVPMPQEEDNRVAVNQNGALVALTMHTTRSDVVSFPAAATSRSNSGPTMGTAPPNTGALGEHHAVLAGLRANVMRAEELRGEQDIADNLLDGRDSTERATDRVDAALRRGSVSGDPNGP